MSIRGRVSVELAVLALGTLLFLTVLPRRPVVLDVALALFALSLVATTARDTRERVWGSPAAPFGERARHSTRRVLIATAVVLPLFGAWRVISGGQLITPTFALALIVFVPWAYLQQALFQFYLLGRVRALLAGTPPGAVAVANGLLFGLVHLPHWDVAAVTVVAGTVWSWYYLRDRYLTPIALSHAVLGTTYFYWVRGEDLVRRWIGAG
jgi:membrane protease YdiL (CAAX protease family)